MDDAQQADARSGDLPAQLYEDASQPFVGRWNRLVSTTNWEKGRIIAQWREALIAAGASHAEYADEAWSQRVGGVTGQHVGRLRRVYQRFGPSHEQYSGLYWSHFQAGLDWQDAEMWLEGAGQNGWSVAQMRRMRWQTLGSLGEDEPPDSETGAAEVDEDYQPQLEAAPGESGLPAGGEASGELAAPVEWELPEPSAPADEPLAAIEQPAASPAQEEAETIQLVRPFANLADLPPDLAEAFESFKLAILRHKTEGWQQIAARDILKSLDALKELVLAPPEETSARLA